MKKKIYFLAPKNDGWTYFYYKEISEYFIKNYPDLYEVYFCHSLKDYIKLHFIKADVIFSIIPFFFKPMRSKKYFFNLHGNYKRERKNTWLWVKLLYFSELNLWFCDKIILTSYYLADILYFREKYKNKIEILPLFIDNIEENKKILDKNNINFLTISSSNFLEKWLWIYDLAKEIFKIKDTSINWKIIFPWNKKNKEIILKKIKKLDKPKNINIEIFDFIPKEKLSQYYRECDIFVYSSNLETWWWVITEACSFGKPIILLDNDLWKYIYPKEFIANNFEYRFKDIVNNYIYYSELSFKFILWFSKKNIISNFIKIIIWK